VIGFDIKITTPRGVFKSGSGLAEYFGELANTIGKVVDEEEMTALAEIVEDSQRGNILKQIQPTGAGLRDLKASTWKRKRSNLKLFETGNLYRSIDSRKSGRLAREIFTDVDYAKYLQYGTTKMKAFHFFGLSKETLEDMNTHIIEKLRARFKR